MWQRKSVELFLNDRGSTPSAIKAFNERADKIADENGLFAGSALEQLIGSAELARSYQEAWEAGSRYKNICFEKKRGRNR